MNAQHIMVHGGSVSRRVVESESHLMRRDQLDEIDAAFDRWLQHDEPDDLTPPAIDTIEVRAGGVV